MDLPSKPSTSTFKNRMSPSSANILSSTTPGTAPAVALEEAVGGDGERESAAVEWLSDPFVPIMTARVCPVP